MQGGKVAGATRQRHSRTRQVSSLPANWYNTPVEQIERIIGSIREKFAPDSRLTVFEVESRLKRKVLYLKGAIEGCIPRKQLLEELLSLKQVGSVVDQLNVLPQPLERPFGLVKVSCAMLYHRPGGKVKKDRATQALYGTVLKVLQETPGWFRVRTPCGYTCWASARSLSTLTEKELAAWRTGRWAALDSLRTTLRPVGGTRLELYYMTSLPLVRSSKDNLTMRLADGQELTTSREPFFIHSGRSFNSELRVPSSEVQKQARRMLTIPYLWAGITPAGFDCSGLVQTIFRRCGYLLPRDSDMQFKCGKKVSSPRAADLVFFGRKEIGHVGIMLDKHHFIHAQSGKGVVISSLHPKHDDYSKRLAGMTAGFRRVT